mmetsp:Transcript_32648/g.79063  ORF Transcript_32648/g.79063 Transcript_32648/m.79063 type:complete len:236 (+) Transcript_32648:2300-3007(+)
MASLYFFSAPSSAAAGGVLTMGGTSCAPSEVVAGAALMRWIIWDCLLLALPLLSSSSSLLSSSRGAPLPPAAEVAPAGVDTAISVRFLFLSRALAPPPGKAGGGPNPTALPSSSPPFSSSSASPPDEPPLRSLGGLNAPSPGDTSATAGRAVDDDDASLVDVDADGVDGPSCWGDDRVSIVMLLDFFLPLRKLKANVVRVVSRLYWTGCRRRSRFVSSRSALSLSLSLCVGLPVG